MKLCEALIDFSWEMLNTNLWVFVDEHWRYVYAYATLYKILLIQMNPRIRSNSCVSDEITKLCDMGLLLSGDILSPYFNKIIRTYSSTSNIQSEVPESIDILESKRTAEEEVAIDESSFNLTHETSPSATRFKLDYFEPKLPVIIDGQMSHWPAMKKWR